MCTRRLNIFEHWDYLKGVFSLRVFHAVDFVTNRAIVATGVVPVWVVLEIELHVSGWSCNSFCWLRFVPRCWKENNRGEKRNVIFLH